MASEAPSQARLDELRRLGDRFLAELDEEYYRHYAGLKAELELEPVYERYAELAVLETAQSVGAAVDADERTRWLWRFTCENHLGALARPHEERVANLEAELSAVVDGDSIPFRMLRPATGNEPDRERRRRLEAARIELVDERLLPVQLDAARAAIAGVRALGVSSYLELYRDGFRLRLDELAEQCRALLDETEAMWAEAGDRLFRSRAGVSLHEAEWSDIPRVFRAPAWDEQFPADGMLPALEGTLADLGIDLRAQRNVHLDVEQRPLKTPRAFCAAIEVPGRVVLVIQPIGGPDDWFSLFHEAGHTEHYAHVSPGLEFEARRLGDNAVTEGWAALFERLISEPAWLTRRLDFGRVGEFAREEAATELYFLRRYCAKLLYELELHAAEDPEGHAERYVELLGEAIGISPSPSDYLGDVDPGFYAASYLRSWAFEAQVRDFLREEFGTRWFARKEAGDLLRELWALGQKPTADELIADVTGSPLEMAAVVDRIQEALAA